jgi:alpha-glucosidase
VRAGSILPREISRDKLELHVYPTTDFEASGRIYSDAGDGYGDWRLDEYQCSLTRDILKINCQTSGNYKTTYQEISIVLHGKPVPLYWNGDGKVTLRYASGSTL